MDNKSKSIWQPYLKLWSPKLYLCTFMKPNHNKFDKQMSVNSLEKEHSTLDSIPSKIEKFKLYCMLDFLVYFSPWNENVQKNVGHCISIVHPA